MRKLNKGAALPAFSDCVRRNKPANWDDFSRNHQYISQESRLHMLCEEQGSLCGYTEVPIIDPFACHIDHYRKKCLFATLTFDWSNFVVATMDDDFGARYKDGHSGINAADYGTFLNPITDKAEDYFEYTATGEIVPKRQGLNDSQRAMSEKTRTIFNLNHPSLQNRREGLIRMINDYGDLPLADVRACLGGQGFKSLVEQFTT